MRAPHHSLLTHCKASGDWIKVYIYQPLASCATKNLASRLRQTFRWGLPALCRWTLLRRHDTRNQREGIKRSSAAIQTGSSPIA
jgi:hypothetical protein